MKVSRIEDVIRDKGMEQGTVFVLGALQEQINTLAASLKAQQELMDRMIDTLTNVVHGAAGMKEEMVKRMKSAGLFSEEDDLGENTSKIGN